MDLGGSKFEVEPLGRQDIKKLRNPKGSGGLPIALYHYWQLLTIGQKGFEGEFSHQDAENRYALDFATEVGTPVLAARAGVVMQVQDGYRGHGLDRARDGGRANSIRILHDDGSMALYAHLADGGTLVRVGEAVAAGQRLGLSGNTGYSTAPHLHFAVQVNRGMQLQSIRFRMRGLAE